jgi:CDP-4-dehydro-6-deoxyglucose reductase, E1
MNEKQLREKIIELTGQYFTKYHNTNKFVSGETYINYSGRVYDEKEGMSLVNASLDFWLTTGEFSKTAEKKLAEYLGIRHSILCNSGSSANLLALSALTSSKLGSKKLNPGDEVITVAAGFPTTINPIYQNGLIPVYCDIDIETLNINTQDLENAVSKRTKAIILAHTLGNPFNLDVVMKLVDENDLYLVEDNCDALGSLWNEKLTGTYGQLSTQSFYPPHHLTMGEGGSVNTNSPKLKKIVESFRDWGRDCWCEAGVDNTCGKRFDYQIGQLPHGYDHKYTYSHIGYNLKLTDLQASVGIPQIEKLTSFVKSRISNHKYFMDALKKYENYIILPKHLNKSKPSWFGFSITIRDDAPFSRSELVNYLEDSKVATRMLFGGNMTKQPAYQGRKHTTVSDLKNTDYVMNNSFWIGVYPGITNEMKDYVIGVFENFFKNY